MGFRVDRELRFTADDAEVLSSLKLKSNQDFDDIVIETAKQYQTTLAYEYGELCATGDAELQISPDAWKAAQYKKEEVKDTLKRSSTVYESLGWFTSMRLFTLRFHRMPNLLNHGSEAVSNIVTYGGLSYILEFVFDLGVAIKTAANPTAEQRKHTPSWLARFNNVMKKDERPMRMVNAAVWFGCNLACLFLTAGASGVVNTALFVVDVLVDLYKWRRDNAKYRSVEEKLKQKIAALSVESRKLLRDLPEITKTGRLRAHSINQTLRPIHKKELEIQKYQYLLSQAKIQHQKTNRLRIYLLAVTTVILIGMAMVFFPPAPLVAAVGLIGAKFIAGCIAFSGSIFAGLGRRLYKLATKPTVVPPARSEIELTDFARLDSRPDAELDKRLDLGAELDLPAPELDGIGDAGIKRRLLDPSLRSDSAAFTRPEIEIVSSQIDRKEEKTGMRREPSSTSIHPCSPTKSLTHVSSGGSLAAVSSSGSLCSLDYPQGGFFSPSGRPISPPVGVRRAADADNDRMPLLIPHFVSSSGS